MDVTQAVEQVEEAGRVGAICVSREAAEVLLSELQEQSKRAAAMTRLIDDVLEDARRHDA
jgi:hypothetical protein